MFLPTGKDQDSIFVSEETATFPKLLFNFVLFAVGVLLRLHVASHPPYHDSLYFIGLVLADIKW